MSIWLSHGCKDGESRVEIGTATASSERVARVSLAALSLRPSRGAYTHTTG